MAKITTPVEGFNGKVAGVTFVDGAGETKDAAALAYFERQGYTIEGGAVEPVVVPEGDPTDKWTVKQLEAYASTLEIDLAGATKKDDILAVLNKPAEPGTPAE